MTRTLYYFFGLLLTLCAICVIAANNTVFSLLSLMLSFLSASVMLIILGADFIGLLLIIIYVGAIAILFLFAVMVAETKLTVSKKNNRTLSSPIGVIFGILMLLPIFEPIQALLFNSSEEYTSFLICTFELIGEIDAHNYGSVLYSYFAIPVLIVGMILLVVILGVSKLTNTVHKKAKTQSVFKQLSRTTKIR
jgi:NADH-quinone oxidoreductase subunit J